jgi:hypothetical protein
MKERDQNPWVFASYEKPHKISHFSINKFSLVDEKRVSICKSMHTGSTSESVSLEES